MTVLILNAAVVSSHPSGATLAEGRSGDLSCYPTQPIIIAPWESTVAVSTWGDVVVKILVSESPRVQKTDSLSKH